MVIYRFAEGLPHEKDQDRLSVFHYAEHTHSYYPKYFLLQRNKNTADFSTIGLHLLITIILAKYSAYPNEMSLPQGILFSLSLMLPPALFITIPLFYYQSIKSLTSILK